MAKRLRTLENFFSSPPAKRQYGTRNYDKHGPLADLSTHKTYPFPLPVLPPGLQDMLNFVPSAEARIIDDQPDLDLLYFQPYIPKEAERDLYEFLRRELFFYRVKYSIKRGPVETQINTPRYTTVFGIDETSRFDAEGAIIDATSKRPVPASAYKCEPRPIPQCLDFLRTLAENVTGCKFNFTLVNYYGSGDDSISYHSDDERFLGVDPAIASLSLGARRDFLMKHKPTPTKDTSETKPMKMPMASGDMILMRGKTQSNWLHSIPKRKGGDADKGRINITFRRAMVKGGTENYYRYNVGDGAPLKWSSISREMLPWKRSDGEMGRAIENSSSIPHS